MKRRDFLINSSAIGVFGAAGAVKLATAAIPCQPQGLSVDGAAAFTPPCQSLGGLNPDYATSLSPYEVRRLTGSWAPTNGKQTMVSVTPAEWINGDPGIVDLPAVLSAWCGGIGDDSSGKLYIAGGGHGDSANNGVYVFDFNGSSAPTGFSILAGSQSPVSAVPARMAGDSTNFVQYSDGRPSAKHTYDGLVFADGKMYMFGGGSWGAGGFTNDCWKFASGSWSRLPTPPFGGERPWTAYDPSTRKVLYFNPGGDAYAFFNTITETWGSIRRIARNFNPADAVLCHDTNRKRVFVMGSGYTHLWTVNWNAESIVESSYLASGILSNSGVTALYDAARDRVWIFGGRTSSPGYSNLYEMNPATYGITTHALSGDSIPTATTNGTYKRAVLLGNAIGFVSVTDGPAVVIGLP